MAVPVFSVATIEDAQALILTTSSFVQPEHPDGHDIFGSLGGWFKINQASGFDETLNSLDKVGRYLAEIQTRLK